MKNPISGFCTDGGRWRRWGAIAAAIFLFSGCLLLQTHLVLAATIYVDGAITTGTGTGDSWANAITDLSEALDTVASGDEIWVKEGVYYPSRWPHTATGDERRKHFTMRRNVAIYGGFAGMESSRDARDPVTRVTILSGDIGVRDDSSDNCYHVFYHPALTNLAASAILDGFTITGGNADMPPPGNFQSGGGMLNYGTYEANGSSPTIVNCIFEGNAAVTFGGGMFNHFSSPALINCIFKGNTAKSYGGGAIAIRGSSPTLTNCTFSGNSLLESGFGGGGLFIYQNSQPTITNCIFWGNSASGDHDEIGMLSSNPVFSHCIIAGSGGSGDHWDSDLGTDNGGNLEADPMFIRDPGTHGADDYGDLHLQSASPGIDAGDGSVVAAGAVDMDGEARIQNAAVDIGADEVFIMDYGDLPDTYGITVLTDDGARHERGAVWLGATIDGESDGQGHTSAGGDDIHGADDEDGVVVVGPWREGTGGGAITVTVTGGDGYLSAWIDWGMDDDLTDTGDQVLDRVPVSEGVNSLSIDVPEGALPGVALYHLFARFRLTVDNTSLLEPTGYVSDGEVEDYQFAVAVGEEPELTTHAPADITRTTATGNGEITDLGYPLPTEHGICWGTSMDPTTSGTCTTQGAPTATGVFTSQITGLSWGVTYYCRAYAVNARGTGYGANVSFTTPNDAPTISAIADQSTNEDTPGTVGFTVDDTETPGGLLVTTASDNPALLPDANIVSDGSGQNRTLILTPATNASGVAEITVTVSDTLKSASTTFTLTVNPVNDAPDIGAIANQTTNEDTSLTAGFTVGDAETAAGALTVTAASNNPNLLPNAGIVLGGANENRDITLTPVADASGTATVTVTVDDGDDTVFTTFDLTVVPVNDPPTISAIANHSTVEDTPVTLSFTVGDVETDAASLTVTAASYNQRLLPNSGIRWGGSGMNKTLTLTPATDRIGTAGITVAVSDTSESTSTSFILTVTPSDRDGDGIPDRRDGCPDDPDKTKTGICGCGVTDTDTDGDQVADCIDADDDNDGLADEAEANVGTDATRSDTDGDGIEDGREVYTYTTDPTDPDTDRDGLDDGEEVMIYGTDPLAADTDGDFCPDRVEVKRASDPNDSESMPTPMTLYVNADASVDGNGQTWEGAYTELSDAFYWAAPGDEIWVAAGIYTPAMALDSGDERTRTFQLAYGVAAYGGFAGDETDRDQRDFGSNRTILSGDIGAADDPSDNCYHLFYHTEAMGLDETALLSGFTLTGANADGDAPHNRGGAMHNDGASPTILNCIFTDNAAGQAAGIFNANGSAPSIRSCVFTANSATDYGGAMANIDAGPVISGCTFTGNSAENHAGAVLNQGAGEVVIRNTILWGNQAQNGPEIHNAFISGSITLTASNVEGCLEGNAWDTDLGADGGGNIDADPMFVSSEDLHLAWNSPCIDAGDSRLVTGKAMDMDGETRISGAAMEMGADEFTDTDGDRLSDYEEKSFYRTDPRIPDTDGDGLIDGVEVAGGLDPLTPQGPGIPVVVSPEAGATQVSLSAILAVAYGGNAEADTHLATRWQVGLDATFSSLILDITTANRLLSLPVPDLVLETATAYYWRTRFTAADGLDRLWSDTGTFTTASDDRGDADGNGMPDNQELSEGAIAEIMPAGESGWRDDLYRLALTDEYGDVFQAGLRLADDETELLFFKHTPLSAIDAAPPATIDTGLFGLKLRVPAAGGATLVRLYFSPYPPGEPFQLHKYDTINGWLDYSGYATPSDDRSFVTVELVDGGFGDADGVANGIIVDPLGAATSATDDDDTGDDNTPAASSGGGGGGCFISAVLR